MLWCPEGGHRVRDDLESHRSALKWLVARSRSTEANDIAWGLVLFWLIRGRAAEGLRWYEQILNLLPLPPAVESRALVGAALMWYAQGDFARAHTGLERGLPLAQGAGDMYLVAQAQTMFGHVEHAAGNLSAARERFTRGIEGFQALGVPWGIGSALSGKAGVALAAGDIDEAERLLDEATSELRHAGPWFLTPVLCFRATLAVRRGNADEAIALMRESLTHIRELHDKYSFLYALLPLAAAAALKGDAVWAARILGARDTVAERTGETVAVRLVHDLLEQSEREARARLGPDRWGRAYAAGRGASIDSLLKDIESARR